MVTVLTVDVFLIKMTGQPAGIDIGLCLPDSCSNNDTKDLLNSGKAFVQNTIIILILFPIITFFPRTAQYKCLTLFYLTTDISFIESS